MNTNNNVNNLKNDKNNNTKTKAKKIFEPPTLYQVKDYFTDPKTGAYTLDDRIKYVNRPYDILEIETLIKEQIGRDFAPSRHPILHRTLEEMAADFLKIIPK